MPHIQPLPTRPRLPPCLRRYRIVLCLCLPACLQASLTEVSRAQLAVRDRVHEDVAAAVSPEQLKRMLINMQLRLGMMMNEGQILGCTYYWEGLGELAAAELAARPPPGQPPRGSPEELEMAREVLAALGTRGCAHLACTALGGASEEAARGRKCGGCRAVRYCSEACSKADWRAHRRACKLLTAPRDADGSSEAGGQQQERTTA